MAEVKMTYTGTEIQALLDKINEFDPSLKADKETTLSGYGITDAYTKDEVNALLGDVASLLDGINGEVI